VRLPCLLFPQDRFQRRSAAIRFALARRQAGRRDIPVYGPAPQFCGRLTGRDNHNNNSVSNAKPLLFDTAQQQRNVADHNQREPMGKRSPNATDVHIGKRLRIMRLARGLNQTELGKPFGITFQQIQKYENGRNRIGAGRLQEFANLLGVTPTFFFADGPRLKPGKSDGSETTDLLANKDGLAVARAFDKIRSRAVRRKVVELIERLAAEY